MRRPQQSACLIGALGVASIALTALALAAPASKTPSTRTPEPHSIYLGYGDTLFTSSEEAVRDHWIERATESGASIAHIYLHWSEVAPKAPPAGFNPTDPNSPGYNWERIDAAVRTAADHGLRVLITAFSAPKWAEGPGRPANAPNGTWEPQPAAYGAFAQALASRYDGSFPDPLRPGSDLPRVRFFEAWNEPNLDEYLSPQWGTNERWVGPGIYRNLLNSFYAGVKEGQPGAKVLAGSLAPYGDPPGGARTPPVEFLRSLLCLRGGRLKPLACRKPARFDILSDHPVSPISPPRKPAASPLDASTADLGRLTRVLHKAERVGSVIPPGHKGLWVTEFWTDTNPPDPEATPINREARWYEQDLYLFWQAGAEAAIEYQLVDSPPGKDGYRSTLQSGVFFLDGQPKPSQTAMRFPFVAHRSGQDAVSVWGIAPNPGRVRIQALRGGAWQTLASVRAKGLTHPFVATLPLHSKALLRARLGAENSLTWKQG